MGRRPYAPCWRSPFFRKTPGALIVCLRGDKETFPSPLQLPTAQASFDGTAAYTVAAVVPRHYQYYPESHLSFRYLLNPACQFPIFRSICPGWPALPSESVGALVRGKVDEFSVMFSFFPVDFCVHFSPTTRVGDLLMVAGSLRPYHLQLVKARDGIS